MPDLWPARYGLRRTHAHVLACALIATLCLPIAAATAASPQRRPTAGDAERRLRAQETRVLGGAHAADHAGQRAARRSPAARRRMARLRKALRARRPMARAAAVPSEDGQWAPPFVIPAIGIHASLLPTGKVLWFYRTAEDVQRGQATLWDPATGTFKQVPPPLIDGKPANIFCAGQSLLPDGRLLVMGGQLGDNPESGSQFKGLDAVFTFNPYNETWTRQPDMSGGRWYPTQVLLPDGRTVVMGGFDESGVVGAPHNPDIEVFTPSPDLDGVGTVTVVGKRGGTGNPPTGGLYPHLFSMPSGRTLVAGPRPSDSWFLDPIGSGPLSWSNVADPVNHAFGTGVILPSATAESATKVALIAGGLEAGTHVQVFDETAPASGWTTAPALNVARSHHNTVLLPDGSMVTVGGGLGNVNNDKSLFLPENLSVELYDPSTGTWRQGPSQQEGRAYHSTALLLPDGRVVSAGDDTNGGNSTDTAEIYSPPYLFKGARPAITGAPAGVGYGEALRAEFSGSDVASAVLVAPGATTHANDMSQRYVPLRITGRTEGSVTLAAPAKAELAPPGHYMLFLLNAKGVPSEARFVRLGGNAAVPPPDPDPDPDPTPVASVADAFSRTVAGGWGSADAGGPWTVSPASAFSVGSGVGSVAVPGGAVQRLAFLESVSLRDVDVKVDTTFGALGTSGAHLHYVLGRRQASGAYLRVGLMASGGKLLIRGQTSTGTKLFADVDTGLAFTAGAAYRLRVQLEGASPTTVRAKAWKVGASEPVGWDVVATSSSGPQVAGALGLRQLTTSHSATTITADNLTAQELAAPAPAESAADAFSRTEVGGWGSADAGGAWTVSAASAFSVGSGVGSVAVPGGAVQRVAYLGSTSARDVDVKVDTTFGALGSSGAHLQYVLARRQASGAYLRVGLLASGGKLLIRGQSSTGASLFADVDTGLGFTAGQVYRLRVQLEGASPTTIRAKAWKVGASEPAGWDVVATSSSGPQMAGALGLRQLTTSQTATTITADNLTAEPLSP